MNSVEHRRKAEELLRGAAVADTAEWSQACATAALAHATLAGQPDRVGHTVRGTE